MNGESTTPFLSLDIIPRPAMPAGVDGALADKAGITREYVNKLEGGKYDPTLGTVQRLAKALGVKWTAFADAGKGE